MPHPAIKSISFQPTVGGYAVGDTFRHKTLGECQVQAIHPDDQSLTVVSVRVNNALNNTFRLRDEPRGPNEWAVTLA